MKIIYCIACTCNPGGMEKIVTQKANWFAKKGHEVIIITTDQKNRDSFFYINPKIRCIDLNIRYSDNIGVGIIKKFFSRQIKIRRHEKLLKNILYEEKPDITVSTFGNEVEFLYKLRHGGKKILEIHFSRWFRLQNNVKGLFRLANKVLTWQDKIIVKKYDEFVCLTKEDLQNWNGLNNAHVIPNFTDISPVTHSENNYRAIAVGRLTYQKGYDRMINAWKIVNQKYPNWKLDIYGDGELKEDLLEMIERLGLEGTIKIYNPVSDIEKKFANSDFLILSSHYEGLPMVMIEAMRCSVPVVSFDYMCGPKDVINKSNGILVPNDNINKLGEQICSLAGDADFVKALSRGAQSTGRLFTPQKIMPIWEQLFIDALNK